MENRPYSFSLAFARNILHMFHTRFLSSVALQDELHRRIIGQGEAVDAVAEAVQRSRADVADLSGPIASFMFLGPTGGC